MSDGRRGGGGPPQYPPSGGKPPGDRPPRRQQVVPDRKLHRVQNRLFQDQPGSKLSGYASVNLPLIRELPQPIAYSADIVAAQSNVDAQIDAIINAFRCSTRFLALVALAQYLRGTTHAPEVNKRLLLNFTKRMSDGAWVQILRECLRPFAARPHESFAASLVSAYFYPATGEMSVGARKLEEWVQLRNRLMHPEAARSARDRETEARGDEASESADHGVSPDMPAEKLAEHLRRGLADWLADLEFLVGYELFQPIKVSLNPPTVTAGRVYRGPSLNVRYLTGMALPVVAVGLEPEESVVLVPTGHPERQLLLSPFFVVGPDGVLCSLQEIERDKQGQIVDARYVTAAAGRDAGTLTELLPGSRHLEELIRLTATLGRVGVTTQTRNTPSRHFRAGEEPWHAIERWARAWLRADCSYDVVLEFDQEDDLKASVSNPDIWRELDIPETKAFVLLLALHYRLSWLHWVEVNATNAVAATQLLRMLRAANRYNRPRLRALYALQLFDRETLDQVLADREWPAEDLTLIRRYVLTGRVKEYLRFLAVKGPYPLPQKADQVLTEIEPTGVGGIDLPLGPDDEDPEAPVAAR